MRTLEDSNDNAFIRGQLHLKQVLLVGGLSMRNRVLGCHDIGHFCHEDPVQHVGSEGSDLQDIVSYLKGRCFDVAVSVALGGSNLNGHANAVSELGGGGKDKVALAVNFMNECKTRKRACESRIQASKTCSSFRTHSQT